ncbi:MAG: V-type ATP synthase subunit K [Lentisphaerae bacterium GWF2_57_35]|nr:MAG: V-type ATP synthase subunit K [Lentisphaerae bacterium GWF2_57_35]
MAAIGQFGAAAVLGLSAAGSALGAGTAGMAAIGAWKKCYAQNKTAPFILVTFIGAPMSQTIYGFILMNKMIELLSTGNVANFGLMLGAGLLGGLGIGASAWFQGKAGAAGADAMAETNQGFGNYLMTLGVIETVALLVMVFTLIKL